ncbi:MAG: class I SAM-dependent methyltransferase [bacterium]
MKNTSWNKVAGWYDGLVGDSGSDYHANVIIPGTLKLLKPKKGEKILDVACGQGVFCRELARLGAIVTGIDASKKLIAAAKERSPKDGINYLVADAADLKQLPSGSFDAATCIMAIQNMEPLEKVISEIARLANRIILVFNHPCFRIPRQSGWGFDEKRKLQYRRVDSYLSEQKIPIQMHPGHNPDVYTWTFHRPLVKYFNTLNNAGLAVTKLEEWVSHRTSKPGANQRAENRSRSEIPMFIAIGAVKIG